MKVLIKGVLGLYVTKNLDTEKNELLLSDTSILVNSQSVHDTLGIPISGRSIESLEPRSHDDPFIREWKSQFGDKSKIRPNDISDVIISTNDSGRLFMMNFLMLFTNTIGMCKTSGDCNMYILKKIRDDVCVAELDWCSYIMNCLKESKNKWVNPVKHHYTGPLTFMILLYLHSTRCDHFDVIRQTPAIRYWKSGQMTYREKLEIEEYGGFGRMPKHEDEAIKLQSEFSKELGFDVTSSFVKFLHARKFSKELGIHYVNDANYDICEEIELSDGTFNYKPLVVESEKPKIGSEYPTIDKCIELYAKYAKKLGFTIKKSTQEKLKSGIPSWKYLLCNREGLPNGVNKDTMSEETSENQNRKHHKNRMSG
ncbi:hypothetical protein Tco_1362595 [Tanacetum coccineum]